MRAPHEARLRSGLRARCDEPDAVPETVDTDSRAAARDHRGGRRQRVRRLHPSRTAQPRPAGCAAVTGDRARGRLDARDLQRVLGSAPGARHRSARRADPTRDRRRVHRHREPTGHPLLTSRPERDREVAAPRSRRAGQRGARRPDAGGGAEGLARTVDAREGSAAQRAGPHHRPRFRRRARDDARRRDRRRAAEHHDAVSARPPARRARRGAHRSPPRPPDVRAAGRRDRDPRRAARGDAARGSRGRDHRGRERSRDAVERRGEAPARPRRLGTRQAARRSRAGRSRPRGALPGRSRGPTR